jgi:hypothetical protein
LHFGWILPAARVTEHPLNIFLWRLFHRRSLSSLNDPPRIVCRSNGSKDVPILKKARERKQPRWESNLAFRRTINAALSRSR